MAHALRLAARGLYTTDPNPRVGCVIACGEEIIGAGWHARAGEPHAEVFALRAAGARARGATAYVTLEPCAHHGRTPPCADALIEAGVARVVCAVADPFPQVAGAGLDRLRAAGIATEVGLLADAAEELNVGFLARHRRGRPWVRVKLAASLDGRTALASGESQWISSEASRADVQRWRARASAILTGIGTVRRDDPRLDVRIETSRQPDRYVVDPRLTLSPQARLLASGGPVSLIADRETPVPQWLQQRGLEVIGVGCDGTLDLSQALAELAARGVNELHVEAGSMLCGSLLAQDLLDELILYVAPHVLGSGRGLFDIPALESMADRVNFRFHRIDRVGSDLRIIARPCSPASSSS